jgi:threonine/homoserine/homoserine lactone efflux protein
MLGIHHYWLFIATAIVLIITPGQDTFFILGRSLSGGRSHGIMAALGVSVGTVIHTVLAALGLSALLATSPYAFMAVKFAGAAYLIYIGVRALKVALFFLALLPQFIAATSSNKVAAFIALGLSFVAMGLAWCVMLAIAAASLRGAFLRRPSLAGVLNKVAGTLFIGLGLKLATARQ